MKLNYDGQEQIQANYDKVWTFINGPRKVGRCLPNVEQIDVTSDRSFSALVSVGVGPVRGKFKFDVQLEPQPENHKMLLKLKGNGLGTAIDLAADANLDTFNGITSLNWQGEADVRGPAATIGPRILDKKAKALIAHVFSQVKNNVNAIA